MTALWLAPLDGVAVLVARGVEGRRAAAAPPAVAAVLFLVFFDRDDRTPQGAAGPWHPLTGRPPGWRSSYPPGRFTWHAFTSPWPTVVDTRVGFLNKNGTAEVGCGVARDSHLAKALCGEHCLSRGEKKRRRSWSEGHVVHGPQSTPVVG